MNGTTKTMPRSCCPSKLDDQARRRQIREATKRPMATLKELHSFIVKTGHYEHVTTNIPSTPQGFPYGRVARRKPLLKKAHLETHLRYAKKPLQRFLSHVAKRFVV